MDTAALPNAIESVDELESIMTRPSGRLIDFFRSLKGDLVILGAGGKMGPSLCVLAARAIAGSGKARRITAVSTFSQPGLRERLESHGIYTYGADVLSPGTPDSLPLAENVIYMIGRKFGSTGAEWNTWATNVYAAGRLAERYATSRIVAFSSGNIYPFVPADSAGATEHTPPAPVGEYAMSCLGRERMFDYVSDRYGARVVHFRLNYAVELRYGVLLDVATKVWNGTPIDLAMGYFNCVWQGYANTVALLCLAAATAPPTVLNVTGAERLAVRTVAERFGELLGKQPVFTGTESPTALLSDARQCYATYGPPDVDVDTLCRWIAHWIQRGGSTLNKPTHFETRDGKF